MRNDLISQTILFSKEECDYLKTLYNDDDFERSRISSNNKHGGYSSMRTSYGLYLDFKTDERCILSEKLKLIGIIKPPTHFSVLRYDVGQEFKKHKDNIGDSDIRFQKRFKTIVIQLSDKNDYDGGELVIYEGGKEITASSEVGNTIVFHSFMEHEVKKVLKGRRYSIVFWIEKEQLSLNNSLNTLI